MHKGGLPPLKLFVHFIHFFLIGAVDLFGDDILFGLLMLDDAASFEELVLVRGY